MRRFTLLPLGAFVSLSFLHPIAPASGKNRPGDFVEKAYRLSSIM